MGLHHRSGWPTGDVRGRRLPALAVQRTEGGRGVPRGGRPLRVQLQPRERGRKAPVAAYGLRVDPLAVRPAHRRRPLAARRQRRAHARPDRAGHVRKPRLARGHDGTPGGRRARAGVPSHAAPGAGCAGQDAALAHPLPAGRRAADGGGVPSQRTRTSPVPTTSRKSTARRPAKLFALPAPGAPAERRSVDLEGTWEYARWDELDPRPETRLRGDRALPPMDRLFWYGIEVPGDRNALRPEFNLAHRSIYRTRVDVPAGYTGRGFVLEFEQFSMVVSVFVNGVYCGASKNMYARWDCDVSEAIRPGQVNEIAVVLKDPHYAIDPRSRGPTRSREVRPARPSTASPPRGSRPRASAPWWTCPSTSAETCWRTWASGSRCA